METAECHKNAKCVLFVAKVNRAHGKCFEHFRRRSGAEWVAWVSAFRQLSSSHHKLRVEQAFSIYSGRALCCVHGCVLIFGIREWRQLPAHNRCWIIFYQHFAAVPARHYGLGVAKLVVPRIAQFIRAWAITWIERTAKSTGLSAHNSFVFKMCNKCRISIDTRWWHSSGPWNFDRLCTMHCEQKTEFFCIISLCQSHFE